MHTFKIPLLRISDKSNINNEHKVLNSIELALKPLFNSLISRIQEKRLDSKLLFLNILDKWNNNSWEKNVENI